MIRAAFTVLNTAVCPANTRARVQRRSGVEQCSVLGCAVGLRQRLGSLSACHGGRINLKLIFGSAIRGAACIRSRAGSVSGSFPAFVERRRLDQA